MAFPTLLFVLTSCSEKKISGRNLPPKQVNLKHDGTDVTSNCFEDVHIATGEACTVITNQ